MSGYLALNVTLIHDLSCTDDWRHIIELLAAEDDPESVYVTANERISSHR